jgi:hypothetical protein
VNLNQQKFRKIIREYNRVYNMLRVALQTLFYSSENWTMKVKDRSGITATEIKFM